MLHIYAEEEIRVGRDDDKWYVHNLEYRSYVYIDSTFVLEDSCASKQHFRVYSIVYEKGKDSTLPLLVYCVDLESWNGTYINDKCIGKMGQELRPYLLNDGDTIQVYPHWTFQFHLRIPEPSDWSRAEYHDLKVDLPLRIGIHH